MTNGVQEKAGQINKKILDHIPFARSFVKMSSCSCLALLSFSLNRRPLSAVSNSADVAENRK